MGWPEMAGILPERSADRDGGSVTGSDEQQFRRRRTRVRKAPRQLGEGDGWVSNRNGGRKWLELVR